MHQPEFTEFFYVFARFEYALKASGHFYVKDGRISPDWKNYPSSDAKGRALFYQKIKDRFPEDVAFLENPLTAPQMQIPAGSGVSYGPLTTAAGDSMFRLVRLVTQVRNNLFHGGKGPSGPSHDAANRGRDLKLVQAARNILEACLVEDAPLLLEFQ